MMIHVYRMTRSSTFDCVCVTYAEALSSFDRNGCAGDHPKLVVEVVSDVWDAAVRHVGSGHRENTYDIHDLHRS